MHDAIEATDRYDHWLVRQATGYSVNRELPTVQLLTFLRAGHGPHHEFPEAATAHIGTFVRGGARTE